MKELDGRVAVIIGGGSGVGRGAAIALCKRGMRIVIADANVERSTGVQEEIAALGGTAMVVRCDVRSDVDIESVRDACLAHFGRVDIVMNSVGTLTSGWPEEVPLEEWQRVVDVNLFSIVRSIRTFVPHLVKAGDGHIVNVSSTAGLYPYSFDRLSYASTKAAIVALSESLALYLRPRGVGVTCVCPGPVLAAKSNFAKEQMIVVGSAPPEIRFSPLPPVDPEVIGELLIGAIESDSFLLLPQPEVHEIVMRMWLDHDAFLKDQIVQLGLGRPDPH
jgi:NAD(P)-dependent dehydrogenase (short-subunit alcohol dehydrogenase family)